MNNAVVVSGKKFELAETTNYVESSLQPEGDVPNARAIGLFSGKHLCVIQDGEIIPVTVLGIKLGRYVCFRRQFIDEYDGTLSEWDEEYGTIIEDKPPVHNLEDKYSTAFYISA